MYLTSLHCKINTQKDQFSEFQKVVALLTDKKRCVLVSQRNLYVCLALGHMTLKPLNVPICHG